MYSNLRNCFKLVRCRIPAAEIAPQICSSLSPLSVSVRDHHPRAARCGGISGCSVDGDRFAAPYQSDLGVEIHGEFRR